MHNKSGGGAKKRLGDILLGEGLINELQLSVALGEQKKWGGRLGSTLVKLGFVTEADMAFVLAGHLGIKWISLKGRDIEPKVLECVSSDIAKKYTVIPVAYDGKTVTFAVADPTDLKTIDTLSFVTGKKVKTVMAVESDIILSIAKHYDNEYIDQRDYEETVQMKKSGKASKVPAGPPGGGAVSSRGGTAVVEQTLSSLIKLLIEKKVISKKDLSKMMREGE